MKKRSMLGVSAVCFIVGACQADLIGSDDFAYVDGSTAGLAGGAGWDYNGSGVSDWDIAWGAPEVASGALETGTSGGNGTWRQYGGDEAAAAVQATGQLYYSVSMTVSSAEAFGGWAGVSSFDFGTERLFFGHPWQDGALGFYGIDETGVGVTLTSVPVVMDVPVTLVTAIDFDNDELLMWINPDGNDFHIPGGGNSADAARAYTGSNWSSAVRLASGSTANWDDLIVSTDALSVGLVPEPTSVALLGLGALGLLAMRRNKAV